MKITFGGSTATFGILSSMAVLFCLPSMAFAGTLLGSAHQQQGLQIDRIGFKAFAVQGYFKSSHGG